MKLFVISTKSFLEIKVQEIFKQLLFAFSLVDTFHRTTINLVKDESTIDYFTINMTFMTKKKEKNDGNQWNRQDKIYFKFQTSHEPPMSSKFYLVFCLDFPIPLSVFKSHWLNYYFFHKPLGSWQDVCKLAINI